MSSRIAELGPAAALLAAGSAIAFLGGCLSLELPETFVVEERGTDELRAVTADDGILLAREFSDSLQAKLDFWTEALRADFTGNRGYTLLGDRRVKDADRRDGVEFLFEATARGTPHRYLVMLFVFEGWPRNTIRVVEFAAPRQSFDRHLPSVRKAILTGR